MPAVTSAFADLLGTKFQTFLVNVGKEEPRQWTQWIKSVDMETNPYLSEKISGMGAMYVKPEGTQFVADLPITGGNFSVTATPYGQMLSITWEMWRDDKYGVMGEMYADMARSVRFRQEVQAFSAFNNAFGTATGYDAATLCNTAHADLDGTTQANRPAVDITISQTAIQAAQQNFDLLNDERSRPLNMTATRLLLHPNNRYLAREILGSSGKPNSAANDLNAIMMDALQWGVSRYLTRTQDWFLMAPMSETDIEFMWRDRPRARTFDDPFVEATDHTTYQRFAVRVGDWRAVYGSSTGV